jgi:hypothetical protein
MTAASATCMLQRNGPPTAADAGDRAAERLCSTGSVDRLTGSPYKTQPRRGPLSRLFGK